MYVMSIVGMRLRLISIINLRNYCNSLIYELVHTITLFFAFGSFFTKIGIFYFKTNIFKTKPSQINHN